MKISLNKTCNWPSIEEQYPNMWAFITEVKEQDGNIIRCKVLDLCTYDERAVLEKKYKDSGISFDCVATTYSVPLGVII